MKREAESPCLAFSAATAENQWFKTVPGPSTEADWQPPNPILESAFLQGWWTAHLLRGVEAEGERAQISTYSLVPFTRHFALSPFPPCSWLSHS
jgi:hypothetical protein